MADNNTNIVCVECIENLAKQIGEQLAKLEPENTGQTEAKYEALDYLANMERVQILELRRQYE